MNKPNKIITHHSASAPHLKTADVDAWHKLRWPDFKSNRGYWVGYHYVIEADGTVVQTRNLDEEGAHTIGQNLSSIGVCFMGNFDTEYPTKEQRNAWRDLFLKIQSKYPNITTSTIYPHRKYANKSCHGQLLSDDYFSLLLGEMNQRTALLQRIEQLKSLILSLTTKQRLSTRNTRK